MSEEIKQAPEKQAGLQMSDYLSIANNVRKNLLRLYRRQKWQWPHLALFPVVFVYFELLLRFFGGTGFFRSLIYPILFGLSAGLFAACLTSGFKPKVNRIISLVLLYAVGLVFTVECLVQYSYQVYMTISSIRNGTGNVVGTFRSDLFRAIFFGLPKIFLFFLPALFYTLTGRRRIPARRYQIPFVGMILVLALVVTGVSVLAASHGKNGDKYSAQYDFNTATQTFGLLTSLRLETTYDLLGGGPNSNFVLESEPSPSPDAETETETEPSPSPSPVVYGDNVMDIDFAALAEETSSQSIADIHSYISTLTPSKQNAYTGLFEGKNLILICAEAFSDEVVSEELTPTLYRMMHNGFYFSDYYQPAWGGSTSTGEFSEIMGIAPINGVSSMYNTENCNNYFTLGNQLQRENYYSMAFHNGVYDVYNRNKTHKNLGYGEYMARGNGLEELMDGDVSDTNMFEVSMDLYLDKQPFSVYYMTLSGHCIYQESSKFVTKYLERVTAVLGDKYKDTTMYYFCYQMELENALTSMIAKLEAAGIADDTVICITSDHYPYGLEKSATFNNFEDYLSDLYGYTFEHPWERDRNGWILWSGCLENEYKDMACEISAPTFSLDIVPTLSNLFGLEYDSRLLVGRDVFSDQEAIVFWTGYSWVTEQGKYDAQAGEYFPNEGYTEDEDYINRIKSIVRNRLNYSGQVIDYDYFGVLFGDDEVTDNSNYIPKATAATSSSTSPAPSSEPDSSIEEETP